MKSSLIIHLEEYMGAKMPEIDSVTQETKNASDGMAGRLAQGAMAAGLVILYKYSRSSDGAEYLLNTKPAELEMSRLLNNKQDELITQLSKFAGSTSLQAGTMILAVTREAMEFTQQEIKNNKTANALQSYFGNQRQSILGHLPPELGLGDIMKDDTLDDRTNKMEGPISSLAHAIEDVFSSSGARKS
ncbi:hypothetical protein [Flavihumibacter sp. UBA7668]|uniref:hypothetical protein n=1 Tax=Flavihumibacter sp. UBA7668 TaxID=1946542 RepID=UPI0025C38511|nr:hypothetical protein [Flavihumibacter sp. UBA7668]